MKNIGAFIILLGINIILLGIAFIFYESLGTMVMYSILIYVIVSTPVYLYLELKRIQKMYKK